MTEMKIYTRTGDDGTTALLGGARVPKHHLRIEAYGTVDELNALIGLIRFREIGAGAQAILAEVQDRLFTVGAILATQPGKQNVRVPSLHAADTQHLEADIDRMNEGLTELRNFILPGGDDTVAFIHLARCVCRRTERLAVHLRSLEPVPDEVIHYLNRLSDHLFVLARHVGQRNHVNEIAWRPRD